MVRRAGLRNKAGARIFAPPTACEKDKEMLNSRCPETVLQILEDRSIAAAKLGSTRS
jgi:hypothetical protein